MSGFGGNSAELQAKLLLSLQNEGIEIE